VGSKTNAKNQANPHTIKFVFQPPDCYIYG